MSSGNCIRKNIIYGPLVLQNTGAKRKLSFGIESCNGDANKLHLNYMFLGFLKRKTSAMPFLALILPVWTGLSPITTAIMKTVFFD